MTSQPQPARPAATAVVARHNPAGDPQFLMQERAESMSFAGGAMVFPGGAVDEADKDHALRIAPEGDIEDLAARIAAVRETIEECGLALGLVDEVRAAEAAPALRLALKEGASLASVADAMGLAFDFDRLIPFARWCPPSAATHRRYDTRFYIAIAGDVAGDLTPDGGETTRLVWHTAREVLDEADAGRSKIIFPTRRNLERLALCASIEALVAHAQAHPVALIKPWVETRADGDYLCIPEGLGYPVTSESLRTALRA